MKTSLLHQRTLTAKSPDGPAIRRMMGEPAVVRAVNKGRVALDVWKPDREHAQRDWTAYSDQDTGPLIRSFAGLDASDRSAREEVLQRAYEIWESEGHPDDRKLANWLQAEAEVLGRPSAVSSP